MFLNDAECVTERDFQRISEIVHRHCGINLHDGKKELVRARIAKRLRLSGLRTASEYLDHVFADPTGREFTCLIDSMSTNLTSFFRESGHFDYLTQTHLPQLLQRKRKAGIGRIRAWSAGCSTGEEPYTLALTLLNATGEAGGWDIKLLATDISTQVLERAKAGFYDKSRVAAVPAALKSKYMVPARSGDVAGFQVAPVVRNMVQFAYLNLMEPWPFSGPFDFIFCRNVMIYFDKPTQERLVNRFWEHLDKGGLLFTGHSESLTGVKHQFGYVQPTIYQKA